MTRAIEPRFLCRGALPEGVSSELECVTNSTLSAVIKQLGCLSRHAEDVFRELFSEANHFYSRMSRLQERVDLLSIKVTQLDSTVEEVSLQDINMRKAFRSSTVQDQQVVSRCSLLRPLLETYQYCDKPPPLNILSPYRDDGKDGLKFYTDPSYFFSLWKEKMLQATENKRKEKRRQKEQKHVEESSGREVKKVRKARNRRQEWNLMAYDKELRPDARVSPSPYHTSDASLSPDRSSSGLFVKDVSQTQSLDRGLKPSNTNNAAATRQHSLGRNQAHHQAPPLAPANQSIARAGAKENEQQVPPAPPPPPPLMTTPTPISSSPTHPSMATRAGSTSNQGGTARPFNPSPPPPPPLNSASSPPIAAATDRKPLVAVGTDRKLLGPNFPMNDARSDLLAAIRRGIRLRQVQEQREQEEKREPTGNDVATILSRRIAVEYSESESEPEDQDWSD